MVTIADRAEVALQVEYAKSESLLEDLLPTRIAARLKAGEVTIADRFEKASILFPDLVGFPSLSQTVTPEELVRLLDSILRRFDELVERHGLQKIRTLGDAHMVTDATRQLLGDRFIVEERGVISVKGLGDMRTYLLTGVH